MATSLLAGDSIFADGLESATTASTHVTTALQRGAEIVKDGDVAQIQRRQAEVLGGSAGGIVLLLVLAPRVHPARPAAKAGGGSPR